MPTPTIPNGEEHFFPIIYEGNGGGQRVGRFVPFTDNGTIANSLIFNDGDSPYMRRTPSGASNRKTFTISFWVKRCQLGVLQVIIAQGANHNNATVISFDTSNRLRFSHNDSGSATYNVTTNRTFEDTSKFYHILASVDTTQSTASDRVKLYVDGDLVTSFATSTYPTQDFDLDFNSTGTIAVSGQIPTGTLFPFDGYLAEINLVDGTALTPDTFGLTNTSTGRWIPKTLTGITYGTNGFRLKFQDSSALGDDTSGNTNDFGTVNGLVAGDQTTDSPTQNHATLQGTGGTLTEGNLTLDINSSQFAHHNATLKPKSGKYYAEFTCNAMGRSEVGVASTTKLPYSANNVRLPATDDGSLAGYMWYGYNGKIYTDSGSTNVGTYATYTTNDIISIALDLDNLTIQFFKNNSSVGTFGLPNSNYTFCMGDGATGYGGGWTANFGQKSFAYTPPTGFVALQQDNLPETAKGIVGLTWIKDRDNAYSHGLRDSSRGRHKDIFSNLQQAEVTNTDGVQKFLKGGIQIEDLTGLNASGASIVSWNWVANGGVTSTNNDGSITSTVQANTTAGFSIVQFTGTGSAATVGHGLSKKIDWMIIKELGNSNGWIVSHKGLTSQATYSVNLSNSNAEYSDAGTYYWNSTAPTSSVFSIATDTAVNRSSGTYVAYCWHGVDGYSKFGSYEGNSSSDNAFVYLGFKPAVVIFKNIDASGTNWTIVDNKRDKFNPAGRLLIPNGTDTEYDYTSSYPLDFLSNGFKIRANTTIMGQNTIIYMAFAEHPFVGDGTSPVTAR